MKNHRQTHELKSLMAWAKSNGAFIYDDLILISEESSNCGACYTTAAIPPSTRLLSIPHSLAITYSNAISQFPPELSEAGTPVTHFAVISAFLALEKLKGTDGFWHPYIAILPSVELGCGGPLFQSPEIIHLWLEGTNLSAREVEIVKEDWRQDWKCIKGLLGSIEGWEAYAESLTWELYLWAASMFASRAFPDKLLSWDSSSTTLQVPQLKTQVNEDGTTQIFQDGVKTGAKPALFPILDMLNHKPHTKITWQLGRTDIGFTGEEFLQKGTEVFNNYGPKPNQQLLLSYGFAIQDNPNDTVMLKLKPSLDSVRQAIRDEQISAKDDVGTYHLGVNDPTTPIELVQLFRIIVANQWELEVLQNSPKDPIMGRNEIAAMTQILRSLQMKLSTHSCGRQATDDKINKSRFGNYATIFRNGQIKILRSAILRHQDELNELYSRCLLVSLEELTRPYRRLSKAIETCFGNSDDRAASGMDEVVFILAICNLLLENQKGNSFLAPQLKELLKHYPLNTAGSYEEEARVKQLYEDLFPAMAEACPKIFGDNRWTFDLLRWGSSIFLGESLKLSVDGHEDDFLVFSK
ncbi:hypothetical protein BGX38DRAFT_1271025 [Terfezia claveryi]|nr:hypothetical protein BGX38DRAFT_1271025 [Terfezia claveryi]